MLVPPTTRINALAANSASGRAYVGMNWTGSNDVYTINYTNASPAWVTFAAITGADVTALVNNAQGTPTTYVGTNGSFIAACVGVPATCTTASNPNALDTHIHALALDKSLVAYAGTDTPAGGKSSFIRLSSGTWVDDTVTGFPTAPIASLAVAQATATDPLIIYAATGTSVQQRTTSSWTTLPLPALSAGSLAQALLVDPARTTTVMVGTSKDGVLRSPDSGTTWYLLNSGLPASSNVTALTFSGAAIYGGTFRSGVFTNPNN